MMKFKDFLSEARIEKYSSVKVPTEYSKVYDLIQKDYSDAWAAHAEKGKSFWRGHNIGPTPVIISKPSTGSRKSEYTTNYYTILLDNNPLWKDYPKRSKSFIGHSSISRASKYEIEGRNLCLVLPKNGSKIAACPEFDIWDTQAKFLNYTVYFADLYAVFDDFVNLKLKDNTIEEFKKALGFFGVEQLIKIYGKDNHQLKLDLTDPKTHQIDVDLFFDYIFKQWDPDKLGFNVFNTSQMDSMPENKELWTDGDCLIITDDYLEELEKKIEDISPLD